MPSESWGPWAKDHCPLVPPDAEPSQDKERTKPPAEASESDDRAWPVVWNCLLPLVESYTYSSWNSPKEPQSLHGDTWRLQQQHGVQAPHCAMRRGMFLCPPVAGLAHQQPAQPTGSKHAPPAAGTAWWQQAWPTSSSHGPPAAGVAWWRQSWPTSSRHGLSALLSGHSGVGHGGESLETPHRPQPSALPCPISQPDGVLNRQVLGCTERICSMNQAVFTDVSHCCLLSPYPAYSNSPQTCLCSSIHQGQNI